MNWLVVLSLSLISVSHAAEETPKARYKLLKDSRSEITIPNYSIVKKRQIFDQVKLVLDEIFPHHETKRIHFGESADHVARMASLKPKLPRLTTAQFHAEMANIFFSLQDLHTSYHYPKPHSCYRTYLPFSFKEAIDGTGKKVIGVSNFVDTPEVLALLPASLGVTSGDVLVSMDGVPAQEQLEIVKKISAGANPDAIQRRGVGLLSFKNNRSHPVPANDEVVLVLQKPNGENYTVTMPWVTKADLECLKPTKKATAEGPETGVDDDQVEFTRAYRSVKLMKNRFNKSVDKYGWETTEEPILKYRILDDASGKYGVLRLDSFSTEKKTINETIKIVQTLLETSFLNTKGLIIDLRDNGGGYIGLAEGLVQLFTPKTVVPLLFRMRNSAANMKHVKPWGERDPFFRALNEVFGTSAVFTAGRPISYDFTTNSLGQSYFGPVTVLTNANCYSSCDMLSALMQDHGAAVIVGEDSTTGAGGANNKNYNDYTSGFKPEELAPFIKLPGDQNIGFSFRQNLRRPPRDGQLIEDIGVLTETHIPTTLEDLRTGSAPQYKILVNQLRGVAQDDAPWMRLPLAQLDVLLNSTVSTLSRWDNIDTIRVLDETGILATVEVEGSNTLGRVLELPGVLDTSKAQQKRLEVHGMQNGKRVARRMLTVRTVPATTVILAGTPLVIDLAKPAASPLVIYQENDAALGWQYVDGTLKIGTKPTHADNLDTTATLFAILPDEDLELNTEFEVETEKGFDFFGISIVSSSGEKTILQEALSGKHELKKYTYDLSKWKGQKVEIRINFNSDAGVVDKGVVIRSLKLNPKTTPAVAGTSRE